MRTKFKAWAEPYLNEHPEVMLDIDTLKELQGPLLIEIGSGKGNFLVTMAKNNPSMHFIGVERNVTCCGFTAKKLVEQEISNAKLMFENADQILDSLKDNTVETIFLNFSDPWPKKRHHKRRLTAPSYLTKYERVLVPNGRVIIKTDNQDLFNFTLENIVASNFEIIYQTENYQELETFDALTEYEASFRELGQPIYRVIIKKK